VLVTFRDGTTESEATRAVQDAPSVSTDQITDDMLVATSVEGDTLVGDTEGVAPDASAPMAKVGVADGSTVVQAVAELEQDPTVESAQPNYLYHVMDDGTGDVSTLAETVAEESGTAVATQSTASINDPYFTNSSLWQLNGTDGVDAATAWNTTKCDGSVSVAIIDTGCLAGHEDLDANIKESYVAKNADSTIYVGHGTHVAGLVSAVSNNGKGVSGVSYNAGLVICKADFTYNNQHGYFDTVQLVDAYTHIINEASTYNIKVINMSLGGGVASESEITSDDDVLKLVDQAYAAGIVTVCAAGNWDSSYTPPYYEYPGDYPTCVSVINTNSSGARDSTSNYNVSGTTYKNISAPGTALWSTYNGGSSSYAQMTGTSMASPVVAGIMALEFAEDPSLTPAQAKGVLYGTATDLGATGWDETYGYGRASASGVVDAIIGTNDVAATGVTYSGADPTSNVTVTTASGATLAKDTDYTLAYSGHDVGSQTATVTGTGSYSATGNQSTSTGSGYIGTVSKSFTIAPAPISSASVAAIPAQEYTGSPIAPSPVLTFSGTTLVEGTDYSVSYADNISAGTATATMTGKGNYTGSVSKTFSIAAKSVASATVASVPMQTYTGSALKPTPTVTLSGYGTLVAGTDYTLSYANNVGAGTATITVTGKGNFSGTRTATFEIVNPYCTDVLGAGSGKAFTIHTELASNRLVDISGRSTANGGNAQMYAGNETPAQRFRATFVRVGSQGYGYYTFANVYSGKVLDVSGGGTTKGTNVQQWSSNGTAAQKWSLGASSTYGGYYVLTNIGSGLVLDISGNSTANGANLQIWGANGTSAQAFAFDSCQLSSSYVATGSAHAYYIHNVKNSSRVVDVSGGSAADGANIWLYDSNGTSAQSFYFSYEASTGYYLIHNTKSGKVVDVAGAGTENGSNIWQYSSNGTWAQKWSVKRNSDGTYTFFCACNGRCFDVDGGLTTNGRNIWCWDSNGTTAQRWTLEAA
jgi:subtilisin family serine protease